MTSQITCIKTPSSHGSHEAIIRVGGIRPDGARFNISRQRCAEDILNEVDSYCVLVQGIQLSVIAYRSKGEKYIKTRPGKDQADCLLSFDQC